MDLPMVVYEGLIGHKCPFHSIWQRCVGVEPTRDCAEQPPSRFEDGETHRSLYTSMLAQYAGRHTACGHHCGMFNMACQVLWRPNSLYLCSKNTCSLFFHYPLNLFFLLNCIGIDKCKSVCIL